MVASAEGEPNVPARARPGARPHKSAAAFRTISEVATELDVAQHVLRFWESKFPQVRPLKRGGGRRYYRPEDIELLRQIRSLLYDEGYTIKGAQKLLRGQKRVGADEQEVDEGAPELALEGGANVDSAPLDAAPPLVPEVRNRLRRLREELVALRAALADAAD